MKNKVKKVWQQGAQICLLVLLLLPAGIGFSASALHITSGAPAATLASQSSNSATFTWTAVEEANSYQSYYVRAENGYTSGVVSTSATSLTHSGLPSGTYKFYFRSVLKDGSYSSYIIIDEIVIAN